jgi:hypothetical protein
MAAPPLLAAPNQRFLAEKKKQKKGKHETVTAVTREILMDQLCRIGRRQ